MGIHSLCLPEGVDVDVELARAEDGESSWESQDNPGPDDWAALRHAESAYFAMMAAMRPRKHRRRSPLSNPRNIPSYGD